MNNIFVYFIPTIDENDGRLFYVAEPFIKLRIFEKAIIAIPFEFSIILGDEQDKNAREPSKVVKLTFWDLLETFPALNIASIFIIYHNREIDEIGKQLEGYSHKFWGVSEDPIYDAIKISRQLYSWMKSRLERVQDKELYRECMNFHKRNGIVEIDENDEVQKFFFERALLLRRREQIKRKTVQATISGVADVFEEEAYHKAEQFWEKMKDEGKILYYPPDELPII